VSETTKDLSKLRIRDYEWDFRNMIVTQLSDRAIQFSLKTDSKGWLMVKSLSKHETETAWKYVSGYSEVQEKFKEWQDWLFEKEVLDIE